MGFFVALLAFGLFCFLWKDRLRERGELRFSRRDPQYSPGDDVPLFRRAPRAPKPPKLPRRASVPDFVPPTMAVDLTPLFGGASCVKCSGRPLVRYRNPATGSTLEFCGHHADRSHDALLADGFQRVLDARR